MACSNALSASQLNWPTCLSKEMWVRSFSFWVVAGWIALLIIRPWEKWFPSLIPLHVERTYAIFAMLAIFGAGQFRFLRSSQTTGLALWFIALTFSAVFAIDGEIAWSEFYVYVTVFIFYFALLVVIRNPYQLIFMVTCFIGVMGLYFTKCLWEYVLFGAHWYSMGVCRLVGIDITYAHPNAVACSAALSLPFAFCLWKVRKRFTEHWPLFYKKLFPQAVIGYFIVTTVCLILTNSRSGIFSFVLFVLLIALNKNNVMKLIGSFFLAAIFLAVLWMNLPDDTKGRLSNTWDSTAGPEAQSAAISGEGRVQGLKMGVQMCQEHPLTGVGLGNFLPYRRAHLDGIPLVAHNTVGGVLGEMGIVGGLAFSIFLLGIFFDCRRTRLLAKKSPHPTAELLSQLATACRDCLIILLFTGMFGNNQGRPQLYWVAAFVLLARTFMESLDRERRMIT